SLIVLEQLRAEFASVSTLPATAPAVGTQSVQAVDSVYVTKIYELLFAHFNQSEFETLCLYLSVNHEDLEGRSRADKMRELVLYCQWHEKLAELRAEVVKQRPNIAWPALPQGSPDDAGEEAGHSPTDIDTWVNLLRGCATMTSRERRDDVVRDLPDYIQGNI
ncbi:MAG: hypothetical protein KC496_13375, partial [Anaerolineae bacterium]|nr:hypothetical protein [Anaerolineae bacterium]